MNDLSQSDFDQCDDNCVLTWRENLKNSESDYMYLLEMGLKAEEARSVLPNDCKTELIMTGFISDWEHFFDLRALDKTGKAHPDIKALACPLRAEFILNNYVNY
jgi:thymidylate synthase (FAD)